MLPEPTREVDRQPPRRLRAELATSPTVVGEAQRLRFRVFADELGARLPTRTPGHDIDIFDAWCEHLVVRDAHDDRIVATCRLLTAERAARLGCFYADTEFDLTRLSALRSGLIEVGRACVDRAFRQGPASTLLWRAVTRAMRERGGRYLIGCISVGMADDGVHARALWRHVGPAHLAPIEYRVFPRYPLLGDDAGAVSDGVPVVPPLVQSHLREGAFLSGEPAWDRDFNTADFLLFLPLDPAEVRHARHLLRAA